VAMILAQIASAPLPKPSKLRPDLPPAFDAWFARALDRDPDKRYQNAKELADALAKALLSGRGAARGMSLSSDDEGMVVDELIASELVPVSDPRASYSPATTREPPPPPPPLARPSPAPAPEPEARPAPVLSERPERGSGRAISVLMLVSALSLGAYAIWLYALHPPGQATVVHAPPSAKPHASASAAPAAIANGPRAVETDAYALKIAHAQELLAGGDGKAALEAFKDAMKGGAPVARSVLSHMSVAIEEPSGPCKLTGISRPRPYSIELPVARPTLLHSSAGTVFIWIDNHQDAKKRQAYAVLLDEALRRTLPEVAVTPEASSARQVQLVPAGDKFALLYWDDGGNEPGVYTRFISHDGHIAGPAHRISAIKKGDLSAALTPSENGKYWAAWQEEVDKGSTDIVGRELDSDLNPTGDPVRLTAVLPAKASTTAAGTPSLAVHNGNLNLSFSINRGFEHYQIYALRVPLSDPALKTGLVPPKKPSGKERFVGQFQVLSSAAGKNTTPVITCTDAGCFVAWDDEKAGASVAFIDRDKGQMLWHRDMPPKVVRPGVAANGNNAVISWFDESRLRLAPLTRDGLGTVTSLSRVSGFQPQPDLAAGEKPGEWYISWRDYESAHLEVFALRTDCP